MPRLPLLEVLVNFPDAPELEWQVTQLQLDEAINAPYRARVELESEDPDANAHELLGASCELTFSRGERGARALFGIVVRVDYLGSIDHHLHCALTLVPAMELARQRSSSRIWQGQSVQEIVEQVLDASLGGYGRALELGHLSRGAQPRDYCTQYRETDLDFVCRLLEEEGINYHFVHDEQRGHELLTLCDSNDDYPDFANLDGSALLPLIAHSPGEADLESIQSFRWARRLRPTSVALSGYECQSPASVSLDEAEGKDERGRSRRLYEHDLRRPGIGDLGQRARDQVAAHGVDGSRAVCSGNAAMLAPGQRFTLAGVEQDDTPEEWLVLSVSHDFGRGEHGSRYTNEIECVPAELELRPHERTSKPCVQGAQTATVVGGGEIDVDSLGRIEVQFHWPEAPSFGAGASCRVRCAQSWAGPGWGAQFIPRVGMEVVVEFLDSNPDRPLVTGCVYNGKHDPPFALPGDATQSGWRTSSSPGGGGSNELRFEDAAGAEEIYIHAQRDATTVIKRNRSQAIGNDEMLSVANKRYRQVDVDEQVSIGSNQQISVGADQLAQVSANRTLSVGVDQGVSVGANQSVSVGANNSELVGAHASEAVALTKNVSVGGMLATVVGGAMNTAVGAAMLEEVGGVKTVSVGASSGESVVGSKSVDAAMISHSAGKDFSQSAGANMSLSVGKDLAVAAKGELSIAGSKKGLLQLEDELTIKVGKASITLKKNGDVVIEGAKIDVKGKSSIALKAKKVTQN